MINYSLEFHPVVDGDLQLLINNIDDNSLYGIVSIQMGYTITSSTAKGSIVLVPKAVKTINNQEVYIDKTNKLQCGQILIMKKQWIVESNNLYKVESEAVAFLGFIERIQYKRSSQGLIVILSVAQMLTQFTLLPAAITAQERNEMGIDYAGISSNEGSLKQLSNGSIQYSLMQVAQSQNLYNDPNVFFIDDRIPDKVWIYSDLNTNRDAVLRQAFSAWNVIMFQNEQGNVSIQPLYIDDLAEEVWNNLASFGNINYQFDDNAGVALNQLIQYYMIPPVIETTGAKLTKEVSDDIRAFISPNTQYYPRESALYLSNNYTVGILTGKSIDNSLIKNPTALDYVTLISANGNKFTTVAGTPDSVVQLYGQQEFAQNCINAYNLMVTIPADRTYVDYDLPLSQTMTITLDDDVLTNTSMVCTDIGVMWSVDNGAIITLGLAPIYSVAGAWVKE